MGHDRTAHGRAPARWALVGLLVAATVLVVRSPAGVLGVLLPGSAAAPTQGAEGAQGDGPQRDGPDGREVGGDEGLATTIDPAAPRSGRADVGASLPSSTTGRWAEGDAGTVDVLVEEIRGDWRVEAGAEEAAALAAVAAHAWARQRDVTGPGAIVVGVEAVERPGTQHAVATVLVGVDDEVHRLAFPLRFGDAGPVIAGDPWRLPAPDLAPEPIESTAIGDEVLLAAARRALDAVGIPGDRLSGLEVTDGWPFVARLDDETTGDPWLRWHVDRFVVAGLPLERAGE